MTELLHRAYGQLRQEGLHYVASHQDEATTRTRIGRGECYVGDLDGRLVATVTFKPADQATGCDWYDNPEVASFGQLAVEPYLHRQGIGGTLVALVEERAFQTGAKEIALDTSEKATALIGWYLRRGYRFVQRANWSAVNYRSVVLSKSMTGPLSADGEIPARGDRD